MGPKAVDQAHISWKAESQANLEDQDDEEVLAAYDQKLIGSDNEIVADSSAKPKLKSGAVKQGMRRGS